MSIESISLAYKDGKSDKVYHAQIEEQDYGYVVNFQYGRRGSTLQTGSKTPRPVPIEMARSTYNKLVQEKKSKGYTEDENGTPYAGTVPADQQFGQIPQLLNPIDEDQVKSYLKDDAWFMQEKKDGVRQFVRRIDGTIQGGNRKGVCVPVAVPISNAVMSLYTKNEADFILDGEAMGDVYWPFDIARYGGQSTTGMSVEQRRAILEGLLDTFESPAIGRVPTAFGTIDKFVLFNKIKAERGEGVVFKKLGSKYVAGRPNSGGNALKFKFTESATCIVIAQNGTKRSVQIGLLSDLQPSSGDVRPRAYSAVGNVTIPANFDIPEAGALVEVQYLYAYPGGSLYQPVYKGPRMDKDRADVYSSLKFKQGTTDEEEA